MVKRISGVVDLPDDVFSMTPHKKASSDLAPTSELRALADQVADTRNPTRKPATEPTVMLNVRLPKSIKRDLDAQAFAHDRTSTSIVLEALAEWIAKHGATVTVKQ